jgi:hypothetical protein
MTIQISAATCHIANLYIRKMHRQIAATAQRNLSLPHICISQ